jgi:hypothetical protein
MGFILLNFLALASNPYETQMLLLWKDGLIGDGREYHQSEQWLLILLLNYVRFLVGFVLLNLVFCVVFCRSLSVHCPFSFGHCFSDLRIMIIHFVSSNSSIKRWNSLDFQKVEIRIQTIPTLFQITRNLGGFLVHFRRTDNERWYWQVDFGSKLNIVSLLCFMKT